MSIKSNEFWRSDRPGDDESTIEREHYPDETGECPHWCPACGPPCEHGENSYECERCKAAKADAPELEGVNASAANEEAAHAATLRELNDRKQRLRLTVGILRDAFALRTNCNLATDAAEDAVADHRKVVAERDQLRAENARLNETLRNIGHACGDWECALDLIAHWAPERPELFADEESG